MPIYTFPREGYKIIKEGYQVLSDKLEFDTVILVDGWYYNITCVL